MVVIWEGASGRSKRPACWFLVGNEGEISIQSLYELESKLLKGGYIGDHIGDHSRGY